MTTFRECLRDLEGQWVTLAVLGVPNAIIEDGEWSEVWWGRLKVAHDCVCLTNTWGDVKIVRVETVVGVVVRSDAAELEAEWCQHRMEGATGRDQAANAPAPPGEPGAEHRVTT